MITGNIADRQSTYQPLLSNSLIADYLEKRFIDQIDPSESKIHFVARRCLQVAAVVGAMSARLLFIRVSLDYAGDNEVYGGFLAGGSSLSYGAIISWCLLQVIDDVFSPKLDEEKLSNRSMLSSYQDCILKTCAIGIGIFSQSPMAYMAYYYNNRNILFPIAELLIDSGFPIYSLSLAIKKILKKKNFTPFEEKLDKIRQKVIFALNESSLKIDLEELSDRVKSIKELKGTHNNRLTNLISLIFHNYVSEGEDQSIRDIIISSSRWGAKAVGGILSIAQLILSAVLGYRAAKLIYSWSPTNYVVGGSVFLVNSFLNMKLTINGIVGLYDETYNCIRRKTQPTLGSSYYPFTQKILQGITIGICCLSYGGPIKVSQDFFSGWFSYFMQSATASGTILLSAAACLNLVNIGLEKYMLKRGTSEMQANTYYIQELRKTAEIIGKGSIEEFAKFLYLFPDKTLKKLVEEPDDLIAEIQSYLNHTAGVN